jgi:hypothetical protein
MHHVHFAVWGGDVLFPDGEPDVSLGDYPPMLPAMPLLVTLHLSHVKLGPRLPFCPKLKHVRLDTVSFGVDDGLALAAWFSTMYSLAHLELHGPALSALGAPSLADSFGLTSLILGCTAATIRSWVTILPLPTRYLALYVCCPSDDDENERRALYKFLGRVQQEHSLPPIVTHVHLGSPWHTSARQLHSLPLYAVTCVGDPWVSAFHAILTTAMYSGNLLDIRSLTMHAYTLPVLRHSARGLDRCPSVQRVMLKITCRLTVEEEDTFMHWLQGHVARNGILELVVLGALSGCALSEQAYPSSECDKSIPDLDDDEPMVNDVVDRPSPGSDSEGAMSRHASLAPSSPPSGLQELAVILESYRQRLVDAELSLQVSIDAGETSGHIWEDMSLSLDNVLLPIDDQRAACWRHGLTG